MTTYTLNLQFSNIDLENIHATGSYVAFAKPLVSASPEIVWQTMRPLQANSISFVEESGIYASTNQATDMAVISQMTVTGIPAIMGKLYTLESSGMISGPADGGSANTLSLLNTYAAQPFMTIGAYQDATINGTVISGNATSANSVLLQSTIEMIPQSTLYIWIQSDLESNQIAKNISSPMTEVKFGGGVTDVTMVYDAASGKFIPSN